MPGLPPHLMKKVGKGQMTMKEAWAKHKGSKGSKSAKKKSASATPSKSSASPKKKFTVSKALDLYAVGGVAIDRGILYSESKDENHIHAAISLYTGFNPKKQDFGFSRLGKGWGGSVNRIIEKKAFKAFGVRGPRTAIKTIGDVLDHATYFGATAVEAYPHLKAGDYSTAHRKAYEIQNGIRFGDAQYYRPGTMITKKWAPYLAQKYIRKGLRQAGMSLGGLMK